MVSSGYTMFKQQTGGSDGITAAGAEGFVMIKTGSTALPGDLWVTFNAMGAVTACASSGASWTEDGTINLMIADGSRPASAVNNWPVSLRRITPNPLTIQYDGNAGSVNLAVSSDPGPWDWSEYSDGLALSVLTASNTPNSATLLVSWEAGSLATGESGEGSLKIVPSDGDIPYAVVGLSTTVVTVSCCVGYRGNVNCSEDETPDISDITRLIDYLYISHSSLCCPEEADVNGSGDPEPDISDITRLIDHLYLSHEPLVDCP